MISGPLPISAHWRCVSNEGHATPSMLLSYLMCVMFASFGAVAIVCHATGLDDVPGWEWRCARVACARGACAWHVSVTCEV